MAKTPRLGPVCAMLTTVNWALWVKRGVTWLVGISPQEILSVYWAGKKQCELRMPDNVTSLSSMLLLPCAAPALSTANVTPAK
ncbi:Outer membrane usher protein papC precursor [Providencia stuartii]|nr:Outer membrane usher protein papC precursor [Providencia stuartii]